jgi:ATP-dependent DNA helicase RecG
MSAEALQDRLRWEDPVGVLPGLGPGRTALLAAAGVRTVGDLLLRLPRAYLAPAEPATAADLEAVARGELPADPSRRVRLDAVVLGCSLWPPGGRRSVLTVRLRAEVAPQVPLRAIYFAQPYLKKAFPAGRALRLEGPLSARRGATLVAPRVLDAEAPPSALEPQYDELPGVPPAVRRRAVLAALPALAAAVDPIPSELRTAAGLVAWSEALALAHAPLDDAALERARRRLALQEILRLERTHRAARASVPPSAERAVAPAVWERIHARLPFALSAEQEAALGVLREELARGVRLQRLLHGEVGSGKTAVAFALALAVIAGGGQAALLAPTEILARQHLAQFRAWLRGARVAVVGLLGDDPATERAGSLARLASDTPVLAVGTHALFAPAVRFARLRLVVFDEQHRFGVRQKAALLAKGEAPHVLTMTATPIPRTLAWARYGALDPLVLRARVGAAAPITTRLQPTDSWLQEAARLRPALERGARAFFVAPRIDGDGGLLACAEALRSGPWQGLRMELVHGRLGGAAIEAAVARFRSGEAAVLCGTTVVEVGLDVAGVEHMLIVGAERLGLASLHQLRGRLARGSAARAGECCVFAAATSHARLARLTSCTDGFQIAEADLATRGPGSLRGVRQHGAAGFRLFDPARDADLVELVRGKDWETVPAFRD